jgi:putative mycofactocin binding protein MftB
MPLDTYLLCSGVRARREEFGLLFYNSRDAKLTFVKSGDLLNVERRAEGTFVLASTPEGRIEDSKVGRYIASLVRKGLILEAPYSV